MNTLFTDHVCKVLTLQLRLIDAGYIVEAQELEIFKSEIVCQNEERLVKTEEGSYMHPRIAAMFELLKKGNIKYIYFFKY